MMKFHACKGCIEKDCILGFYTDSWQLGVPNDYGSGYSYIYVKYCPFCGKKLEVK